MFVVQTTLTRSTSLPDDPPLQPPSLHLPLRLSLQQPRLDAYLLCVLLHHSVGLSCTVTSLNQHDRPSGYRLSPTRAHTVTDTDNIHCSIISCERTQRSPSSDRRLGGSAETGHRQSFNSAPLFCRDTHPTYGDLGPMVHAPSPLCNIDNTRGNVFGWDLLGYTRLRSPCREDGLGLA
jgi:hypothetical protein